MLTNLIIPVQDTESAKFNYDGNLTRDAFESMVLDQFHRTDRQIDAFLDYELVNKKHGVVFSNKIKIIGINSFV